MKKTKTISKVNRKVIDFIKAELTSKKERHKKLVESINPSLVEGLKKMKKVEQ